MIPLFLLAALALALPVQAATYEYTAGPVRVRLTLNDMPHCVAPLPNVPCPVGVDDAGTPLDPTDDTIYQYTALEDLDVDADLPLPGSAHVAYDHQDGFVEHPLINTVDSVLIPLVDGLPPPLDERVDYIQGHNGTAYLVKVLDEHPITGEPFWLPIPNGLPLTNRSGTRIPHEAMEDESDTWAPHILRDALRLCYLGVLGNEQSPTCGLLPADTVADAWTGLTPNVITGVAVNHTSLRVGEPPEGQHRATGETPAPVPGKPADADPPVVALNHHGRPPLSPDSPWEPARAAPATAAPRAPASEVGPLALSLRHASSPPPWLALGATLLCLALALLAHRITRQTSLDHHVRAAMLRLVEDHPGMLVS